MRITGGRQRGRGRRISPILLAALPMLGCGSSVGPTEPSGAQTTSEIEYQLLQLANRERDSSGIPSSLIADASLSSVARQYSEQMRDGGFFSHVGPDGADLRQRLEGAGITYTRAGENIAQVSQATDPSVLAHDLLMDSERHRANILDPEFKQVGIGVARSSDTFWITQIFVTP